MVLKVWMGEGHASALYTSDLWVEMKNSHNISSHDKTKEVHEIKRKENDEKFLTVLSLILNCTRQQEATFTRYKRPTVFCKITLIIQVRHLLF